MDGLVPLLAGLALLVLVWWDRRNIGRSWRDPARWWSRNPEEAGNARAPSQPFNTVIGTVLGVAGVIYGLVALVT